MTLRNIGPTTMPYPWIRPLSSSGISRHLSKIFAYRMIFYAMDVFVYFLGPVLILLAIAIISGMCYTFSYIIVPMMNDFQNDQLHGDHIYGNDTPTVLIPVWMHQLFVVWVVCNIIFNYFMCVTSRKDRPGSKYYENVVRELASVTGFKYPESEEEKDAWIIEWRRRRLLNSQNAIPMNANDRVARDAPQATKRVTLPVVVADVVDVAIPRSPSNPVTADDVFNGTATVQTIKARPVDALKRSKPSWMDLNPYEWSYCYLSNLPKAPRSHFDHVTQSLILNMDHYCPWMFNTSMIYGVSVSYYSFMSMDSPLFDKQHKAFKEWIKTNPSTSFRRIYPFIPLPVESTIVTLSFILCLTLGISVILILAFHIYLILTAQTTIEFYGNLMKRSQYKLRKMIFKNPYSLGPKRNLQQIFGSGWIISWLLPSTREPEYLPIPLLGDKGLREQKRMKHSQRQFSMSVASFDSNLDV